MQFLIYAQMEAINAIALYPHDFIAYHPMTHIHTHTRMNPKRMKNGTYSRAQPNLIAFWNSSRQYLFFFFFSFSLPKKYFEPQHFLLMALHEHVNAFHFVATTRNRKRAMRSLFSENVLHFSTYINMNMAYICTCIYGSFMLFVVHCSLFIVGKRIHTLLFIKHSYSI